MEWNRKKHWENIYQTKTFEEVSWYQRTPQVSLDFFKELEVPKDARIIDIGGGDSYFVDYLLLLGYQNITVLDISEAALEKAKQRLGKEASAQVQWIVGDIVEVKLPGIYDVWHDRAAFHFLIEKQEVSQYIQKLNTSLSEQGIVILGTFSEEGPLKCSGIPIQQYSEDSLTNCLKDNFNKMNCKTVTHQTPFGTQQNFIFCSFKKKP